MLLSLTYASVDFSESSHDVNLTALRRRVSAFERDISSRQTSSLASSAPSTMSLQVGASYTIASKATGTVADYSQRDLKVVLPVTVGHPILRITL